MASSSDYFKKSRRKFSTTVGVGGISAGGTTLPLASVTGLDTDTAIILVIDAGTANEEVITGVVSGSNVIGCIRGLEGTTGVAHTVNAPVTMYFTESHWDSLINGLLVSLNQDGTLKDNIVSTAKLVDGSVTSAKILDGTIATTDIADLAVTAAKLGLPITVGTNAGSWGGDTNLITIGTLKICWGTGNTSSVAAATTSAKTVSFPTTFSSVPAVWAFPFDLTTSASQSVYGEYGSRTTTSISITHYNASGVTATTRMAWLAIGT